MKKIIFLLCITLLCIWAWTYHESMAVLNEDPLENIAFPKTVDRYTSDCKSNEYKYCYNGDLSKKDIFGNHTSLSGETYTYGQSFSAGEFPQVRLSDYNQTELKGSSRTRDVFYDPYTRCNPNYPWRLDLSATVVSLDECTSVKDIESYNQCLTQEKKCPFEDLIQQPTQQYVVYDCADSDTVRTNVTDPKAIFSSKTTEVGTYKDTFRRGLNVYKGRKTPRGQNYNIETCSAVCASYNYFGLQNGERGNPECWCGNSLDKATQYGPKACSNQIGGAWCNALYKNVCGFTTTDTTTTSTKCKLEGNEWVVQDMTPIENKCKKNCDTRYYQTAGGDVSHCFEHEARASYLYDVFYQGTSKYPFETVPVNPFDSVFHNAPYTTDMKEGDKVKMRTPKYEYKLPVCDTQKPLYVNDKCYPITEHGKIVDANCSLEKPYSLNGMCVDYDTAVNAIAESCTEKTPYKHQNQCYATPGEVMSAVYTFQRKEGDQCFVDEVVTSISCEELYSIQAHDISMLYNPITNNYVGDLSAGAYSTIDCSGTRTKCLADFPYEYNSRGELVMAFENTTPTPPQIPTYDPPPPYVEPPKQSYLNPYNFDIDNRLFIQCKHDFSAEPKVHMCPVEMPICEGYVLDQQLGLCAESKNLFVGKVTSYESNHLACEYDYNATVAKPNMCPYHFPTCENNLCKEGSLNNLPSLQ